MRTLVDATSGHDDLTSREARAQRIARALILALAVAVGLAAFIGAGVGETVEEAANLSLIHI